MKETQQLHINVSTQANNTLLVTIDQSQSPFIRKVIERVVAQQLNNHLTKNGLHDNLQSAYKSGTSTETAILRIKADIEEVLDEGDAILQVPLDLSASFDTIDHSLLLERLQKKVGLTETALLWMQSYLNGRTQEQKCTTVHWSAPRIYSWPSSHSGVPSTT